MTKDAKLHILIFITCLLSCMLLSCAPKRSSTYMAGYEDGYEAALEETETSSIPVVDVIPTEPSYDYYVLNKKSKKFHAPSCYSVEQMKEENKIYFSGTREEAIENGYEPCGNCKP